MNLSNLNNLDKKQFLHELKNYLISYRDQIGVDEKYTFGVEIEFVGPRPVSYTHLMDIKL